MAKSKDPFGDSVFIRLEVHQMGYGYNVAYSELDRLQDLARDLTGNEIKNQGFIELELLSGVRMFIQFKNISDFSISTPESRAYNVAIEEIIEDNKKEKDREDW